MQRRNKNATNTLPFILLMGLTIALAGCETPTDTATPSAETDVDAAADESPESGDSVTNESTVAPASNAGGEVALTPGNTTVAFVGSHIVESGPDPNARHGNFGSLSGTASVDDGKLTAVAIEIETASLSTGDEKLDGHLKSPDFFDVRENPKATFTSTAVETADDGTVTITGDFQLLKETRSISFPAKFTAEPLSLSAEFDLDRTEFGMKYGVEKIEKIVKMAVTIK